MNPQHLRAFLWLRGRLLVNQLKRGGTANAVVLALAAVALGLFAAGLSVGFFLLGLLLVDVSPAVFLYLWDGLVVALLFCWGIGLLTELQRSEALSLEKFLHMPVSLTGAFLVNYLSSLLSLTLLVFVPAMAALGLGLAFAKGPAMLLVAPLLAAFVLAVTAVTHQFRGWLAVLMVNPRRRRTVIVVATAGFILLAQAPNLVNVFQPWKRSHADLEARLQEDQAELLRARAELQRAAAEGALSSEELQQRLAELHQEHEGRRQEWVGETARRTERATRFVNLVLPPGWLPLGAAALTEGDVLPALLGTLGLGLIGTASLWRSYRTTVRLYTGQTDPGAKRPAAAAPAAKGGRPPANLLERELPWLSEHAAVVALGGFRSLTRAPEAKMALLTPFLLVVVFGSIFLTQSVRPPESVRPLMAFGAMASVLLSMVQLIGNQFGFDRGGFRVFVLCPARRREVLLGKNLAVAPLALALGAVMVGLVQAVYPMRLDHFLGLLPQMLSMYLLFCLLANCLSILAPMPIAAGTMKPVNPQVIPILLQMALVFLFPMVLAPTLLPLGVELLLEGLGWVGGMPVCLALSVAMCLAVVFLYRLVLTWQGMWLHAREQKILDVVTTKAE